MRGSASQVPSAAIEVGVVELTAGRTAMPAPRSGREVLAESNVVVHEAQTVLGPHAWPQSAALTGAADVLGDIAATISSLVLDTTTRPLRLRENVGLLGRVQELRLEIASHRNRHAVSRTRAVSAALRNLRGVATLAQLFTLIPAELCRCGFSRAWLCEVDADMWRLLGVHYEIGEVPHRLRALDRLASAELVYGTAEAEMVRRRRPMLVDDARTESVADPKITELFGPRAYVAAPLLLDTRVVASIHADRHHSGAPLDEEDVDILGLFAEAVSQSLQRVILSERLERLRLDASAAARSVERMIDDRCSEVLSIPHQTESDPAGPMRTVRRSAAVSAPPDAAARLSRLLTAREIEVLRLMAAGETNASIAKELVISEGTVKSHVKNVLRKLHAANRAQAVSRYFRLIRSDAA